VIRAVVFDVGYTLIDEARHWAEWARYLGVSDARFMRELEAVIAEGKHHREVFQRLRPGFDLARARQERGDADVWTTDDLYPDAIPALAELKRCGFAIGLAGNQPPAAKAALEAMRLPIDWIANSAELGVEKPAPEFFAKVTAKAALPASQIAYVGDRLDNDALPAQAAGMRGVFLIRGPWGETHANWPDASGAHVTISSLGELPDALR
jgi:FMN phosphatase YigB (HAD superfamily)